MHPGLTVLFAKQVLQYVPVTKVNSLALEPYNFFNPFLGPNPCLLIKKAVIK